MLPLLVFDTNILMEIVFKRDGEDASMLIQLAEQQRVKVVVFEYVLHEFRGSALQWIRNEKTKLQTVSRFANEWARCRVMDESAFGIKDHGREIMRRLDQLISEVDKFIALLRTIAEVIPHTPEIQCRGDLRFLAGHPPDRVLEGRNDCYVYETLLKIATLDQSLPRKRYFVTRDTDFDAKELVEELGKFGVEIRKDPGRLARELQSA